MNSSHQTRQRKSVLNHIKFYMKSLTIYSTHFLKIFQASKTGCEMEIIESMETTALLRMSSEAN